MAIRDFFSREAGQRRRQLLDEYIGDNIEQFIPPNLRALAGFVAEANPVAGMQDAVTSSRVVLIQSKPERLDFVQRLTWAWKWPLRFLQRYWLEWDT